MTIPTQTSEVTIQGNGANTVFSFAFVYDQAANISVQYLDVSGNKTTLLPTQYTLTLNPAPPNGLWGLGGTVTYPLTGSPIATGTYLIIQRVLPLVQDNSISNQGTFYPQSVERALDELEMQIQQVSSRTGQYRGIWQTDTIYNYSDTVTDGVNGNDTGAIYMCTVPNLSNVWSTDLAAGDWVLGLSVVTPVPYQQEFYTNNPIYATPMVADAAATAAGGTLVVNSVYAFTTPEVFNAPIVRFASEASWARGANAITFNGVVFAPETQIFDATTTAILFSKNQGSVFARWFGVKADDYLRMFGRPVNPNATDDTNAWKGCANSVALALNGMEVIWPLGVSKVTQPITFTSLSTTVLTSSYVLTGIKHTGRGGWSSVMQSYLPSGTMLTLGQNLATGAGGGNNGYSMDGCGFSSAGTESLLVNFNFCRSMSITRCAFLGGNNAQINLGRAQDYWIAHNTFQGYSQVDPVSGFLTYGTSSGLTFGSDLAGHTAGPSFVHRCLFKDHRNAAHNAVCVAILGGGGHRIENCEIGNADICVDDEVNDNTVSSNRFETSGINFVATAGGGNVGNGTVSYPAGATITSSSGICGPLAYVADFSSATSATVFDPLGNIVGTLTVGTPFTATGLNWLFTSGSIPWQSGDFIDLVGTGDTILLVGNTTRVTNGTYAYNRASEDLVTNLPIIRLVSYATPSIVGWDLASTPLGVVFYFGSDNNNTEIYCTGNKGLNWRTQISDSTVNGKLRAFSNPELSNTPHWDLLATTATPSVRNLNSCDTNNSGGAITIANFTGGYNGQNILVRIRDNLTTITHGTNIQLLANATTTFKTGDQLSFTAYTGPSATGQPFWLENFIGPTSLVAPSTGSVVLKSGSGNTLTAAGLYEITDGVWVHYFTVPNP